MDQPSLSPADHEHALAGLARINWICRAYHPTWNEISVLARKKGAIRVLDVACGSGDFVVNIANSALRSRLDVTVDGCDLSPRAIAIATRRARRAGLACRFFQFDVFHDAWPGDYDIVCSSLFLHHLPTSEVSGILRRFATAARQKVVINDLVRSRFGFQLAKWGTRLLTTSSVVRYDGPVSVANAFSLAELRELATAAGLQGASIRSVWPARMLLVWNKP
jgi:2-polyprenyl-3-methyl-5-hydroxy-6-metoxy-1,4-benzoquinol methylase